MSETIWNVVWLILILGAFFGFTYYRHLQDLTRESRPPSRERMDREVADPARR